LDVSQFVNFKDESGGMFDSKIKTTEKMSTHEMHSTSKIQSTVTDTSLQKAVVHANQAKVELIRLEREACSLWKKAARATRDDFKHIFATPAQV
jgi:hypothetical protein